MESLNKNQIVLLTLLVSFVTSIATGIFTVTLMDQAPAGVTQTINRVVERTIEKVVPGEPTVKTVVKEVPVVVTEEELVVKVINDSQAAVVQVMDNSGGSLGSGFVVSDDGLVMTDAHLLTTLSEGQSYKIGWRTGERSTARLIKFSVPADLAVLRIDAGDLTALKDKLLAAAAGASASTTVPVWKSLPLQMSDVSAGQTVIALGSPDTGPLNVSVGIVSAINQTASTTEAQVIKTNAANAYNLGGPVLNTKGKVVGLSHEAGYAINPLSLQQFISSINP